MNLSLGAAVVAVEPQGPNGHGGTHYRAERWRLTEVSVVVRDQRQEAQVRLLDRDESLPELAARLGPGEDAARQAVRRSLHLERGLAWAGEVAPALVAELGVPPDRLRSLLWVEVAGHGEELVRSLAVPVLARADVGAA